MAVITLAAAVPPRPETICLLMDASRRGGACVVVDGTTADAAIDDVTELVVAAAGAVGVVDSVVLASIRPGRPSPAEDDHWRWFALRDRFADAGIDLLDWFLFADGDPVSMAELTDSRVLW